jgi:hypothetical protein
VSMGLLSRRGFLQTLAAAAVGAAVFDPKSLLWVPAPPTPLVTEMVDGAVALQLELNDLALQCAKAMTDRLQRHASVALREVMFRHAGHVRLATDEYRMDVDELGRGHFEPCRTRLAVDDVVGRTPKEFVNRMTAELCGQVMWRGHRQRVDMFAPIGAELRPGEPFTADVGVGVATDPDSGLSVRVLRYQLAPGVVGAGRPMTSVEMAGGTWHTSTASARQATKCSGCGRAGRGTSRQGWVYCWACRKEWLA